MRSCRFIGFVVTMAALTAYVGGAVADEATVAPGVCHVVIVSGLPGTPVHSRRFADWSRRFRAYCIDKVGVLAANVTVLSGDPAAQGGASADAVLKVIEAAGNRTVPADQFVLFVVGHGDTADGEAVLAWPGRNLPVSELKAALGHVRASNQVVLHFGAAAGDMIAALAATNRVIVTATAPGELADPVYAEFFLHQLESRPVGTVTLLQAFNEASNATAQWIRRISQTELGWLVNGKESIRLFKALSEGPLDTPGARQLDPTSKPIDPDLSMPLKTAASEDEAKKAGLPPGVRVITEHAMLEDAGHEVGVAAIQPEGYVAVAGEKESEPGYRAARVIIGKPGLQAPAPGGQKP